jgi:transcriptional regulator with XRE-family HTH domain
MQMGNPVHDDQVLDKQDVSSGGVDDRVIATSAAVDVQPFPALLERFRNDRGLSKADLAKRANYDPSTITRFEQGSRAPDRAAVLQLSQAMTLPLVERDRLLAAAGFRSVLWDDAEIIELVGLLADPRIPVTVRDQVRSVIELAISHLKLSKIDR